MPECLNNALILGASPNLGAPLSSSAAQASDKPDDLDRLLVPKATPERRGAGLLGTLRNCFKMSCIPRIKESTAEAAQLPDHLKTVKPTVTKTVAPSGLNLTDLSGTHKLFDSSRQQLSPVFAMIYANNGFLESYFESTDNDDVLSPKLSVNEGFVDQEPSVRLAKALFCVVPGGEITPTHQAKNVASHFNAGLMGKLIALVAKGPALSEPLAQQQVAAKVRSIIEDDAGYQQSIAKARAIVSPLKSQRVALEAKFEKDAAVTSEKSSLQKEISRFKRDIKQIDKGKSVQQDAVARKEALLKNIADREAQIKALPTDLLTKKELKASLRTLDYEIKTKDVDSVGYQERLKDFSEVLGALASEPADAAGEAIPLLQTFFWRISRDTSDLSAYLGALGDASLLKLDQWPRVQNRLAEASKGGKLEQVSVAKQNKMAGRFKVSFNKPKYVSQRLDTALALVLCGRNKKHVAPVVPFSYVYWRGYSKFPDCGENALRNVFNQMLYDPDKKCFDVGRLKALKQDRLPNISDGLIAFYEKHDQVDQMLETSVSKAWLKTVSDLNDRELKCAQVHYRKDNRTHVASPMTNLDRVVARLMGIESDQPMADMVAAFADVSGRSLSVDRSGVDDAGHGRQVLTVDDTRFVLAAYKPIHMGFWKEGAAGGDDEALNRAISEAIIKGAKKHFAMADNESARQASLAALTLFESTEKPQSESSSHPLYAAPA